MKCLARYFSEHLFASQGTQWRCKSSWPGRCYFGLPHWLWITCLRTIEIARSQASPQISNEYEECSAGSAEDRQVCRARTRRPERKLTRICVRDSSTFPTSAHSNCLGITRAYISSSSSSRNTCSRNSRSPTPAWVLVAIALLKRLLTQCTEMSTSTGLYEKLRQRQYFFTFTTTPNELELELII